MENASKALIIAGEVLIGVIIITILVFMFNKVNEFTESYHDKSDRQELIAFNAEYAKYITNNTAADATYIYAEEVVTIVNQAIDWNKTTPNDNEKIIVDICNESNVIEYKVLKNAQIQKGAGPLSIGIKEFGVEFLNKYKLRTGEEPAKPEYKFSCEMTISNDTGRIDCVKITNKGERTT